MEGKNRELTDLFKQLMQEKSLECEDKFFRKLTETTFWIPGAAEEQGENSKSFVVLITGDGRKFVPAFLDKQAKLGRFTEEQLIYMPYSSLKYSIIDSPQEISGIVLNPFEENIILDRKIMEIIDSRTMGMTLRREDHSGRVKLRKPNSVPEGLEQELKQFFKNTIEVESAWILKAKREEETDEHWMILIDFYGEKIKLFPQVAEMVKPYMKPGESFELIQKMPDFNAKEIESARIYIRPGNRNLF